LLVSKNVGVFQQPANGLACPLCYIIRSEVHGLQKLSPLFDALYAGEGRPSIPPEQLLKARVLTALYRVRSERLFCKQLGYNLLWLWFLVHKVICWRPIFFSDISSPSV
jgi:hypothetical protein